MRPPLVWLALAACAARSSVVEAALPGRLAAGALVERGRELLDEGDGKLGRGFVSLALHINPFIIQESPLGRWLQQLLKSEPMKYWRGNVFLGHDKTYLEGIFSKGHLFRGEFGNLLGLYAWRNLELVGESCCGMDNVAVWMQQANKHMYLIPFLHLVPGGYGERLKQDNQPMYKSFKAWWEENGRRPMPEPSVQYLGKGKFEWEQMRVAFKKSRVPVGWGHLIEAVLLTHLEEKEYARVMTRAALRQNPDLLSTFEQLLPGLAKDSVPQPPSQGSSWLSSWFNSDTEQKAKAAAQVASKSGEKYIVCYNPHVGLGNLAVVMVSAHMLAKLTGRTLLLHWNVNLASESAYRLKELPGVRLLSDHVEASGQIIWKEPTKHVYFFHMMHSDDLGDALELLGCSDLTTELSKNNAVAVSSNLFFAPILAVNPHTLEGAVPGFPELLADMLEPSEASAERALEYAEDVEWGDQVPVVAVHIRAREETEDNDDWPTADSPDALMLKQLRSCAEAAVRRELKGHKEWDVFIASTTEAARQAAATALKGAVGLREILMLPDLSRSRRAITGAQDAMAEALLISRADVFIRLVVGTSGFSTFAYLSNALRTQNDWIGDRLELERSGYAPNYLVSDSCGPGRCYKAPPDVRMASIAWHGKQYTQRSCGDVVEKVLARGVGTNACADLEDVAQSRDEL